MSIIIDMPAQEIDAIKMLTRIENDAEAVTQAAREFVRLVGLRELKGASGKVEFDSNWEDLEEFERHESGLPE